MHTPKVDDKYLLQSVENALSIIDLLCEYDSMGAAEIARHMGLGKSTVFRLLSTLLSKGYVMKDSNSKYNLSYKFATIGKIAADRNILIAQIHPFLEKLTDLSGETSHLVIRHSDIDIIFIDKVISPSTIRMDSMVGLTRIAHMTGTGKALLAGLSEEDLKNYLSKAPFIAQTPKSITTAEQLVCALNEVREQGFACDDEEAETGLTCYAVPISQFGKVIAAISISGPTARMVERKTELINIIKRIAEEINQSLQ